MNPTGFFVARFSAALVCSGLDWARLGRNFITIEGVITFREDPASVPRMSWDVGPFNEVPVPPRRRRAPEGERDENSLDSSRRRTKRLVRWHCKNIGTDHLITFTTRELSDTPGDLRGKWQRFVKAYREATGEDLPYVAVPEPHPSNPDHWPLHLPPP